MPYNPQDLNRIQKFYNDSLKESSNDDAKSVHWIDTYHQNVRFEVLLNIGSLEGKSVLDVGCGLGDLYKLLLKKGIEVNYTGIDIIPDYITIAKHRYPETTFIQADVFDLTDAFDYVFASGAMSFKIEDHKKFYFNMIKKMYGLAHIGVGFNMLNDEDHIDDATFAAYTPQEVVAYCDSFCLRVDIMTDYLPQDFTVFLYK